MPKVDYAERIKREYDKKEFFRMLLIELSGDKNTPIDILDSEYGEVQETEKEYLLVKADANVSYTCSVGYDRTVTYYENGNKRTKTVTDWQAYSGTNQSEELSIVGNSEDQEGYAGEYEISQCLKKRNVAKRLRKRLSAVDSFVSQGAFILLIYLGIGKRIKTITATLQSSL